MTGRDEAHGAAGRDRPVGTAKVCKAGVEGSSPFVSTGITAGHSPGMGPPAIEMISAVRRMSAVRDWAPFVLLRFMLDVRVPVLG